MLPSKIFCLSAGVSDRAVDIAFRVVVVVPRSSGSTPRTAPTISEANRMLSIGTTFNQQIDLPGWW